MIHSYGWIYLLSIIYLYKLSYKMQKGKKKVDQKELDAQKALLEESKRKEEEERLKMEREKYGVVKLPTGLDLIFTEWCLKTVWEE